ncbi:MAG: hypothetical protein AB7I38_14885 [Dehalococcoidia bacterium]
MTRLGVILFAASAIALWVGGSGVSAQYPPPADTAVVSVTDPTPSPNSIVTIIWRIQSPQGALPPGESRQQRIFAISLQTPTGAQACVPAIASQPGADARLTVRNDPADPATGRADLFTGSTPGAIVVRVTCPQGPAAQITVTVQGAATPSATSTGAPVAGGALASTPRPPSTGFGARPDESRSDLLLASLVAASAVAGAVALAAVARRRASRNG